MQLLLSCLSHNVLRLRWLASDSSLPQKLRWTLWEVSLSLDDAVAGEAKTVELPPEDDDGCDLNTRGTGGETLPW